MSWKLLAIAVLMPAVALAGGYADWSELTFFPPPPPYAYDLHLYLAEGHRTLDLLAVVDAGDSWTSAWGLAYFAGDGTSNFTFWDHPEGGDVQPDPARFAYFGLLRYDSFWSCPEEWPSEDLDPSENATQFALGSPLQNTPTVREAEWYADPEAPNADGGSYVVARYNVMGHPPDGYVEEETPFGIAGELVIEGDFFYESTADLAWPFELRVPLCWYEIPEPGSLALLAVGLALIRRR